MPLEAGKAEIGRGQPGRADLDLAEAEAARQQPLAVAQEALDRLHQEGDQRQDLGIVRVGRRLV